MNFKDSKDMNKFLTGPIVKQLKEKGFVFDLPITFDYETQTYHHSAEPRISQALDWLRTEKNIDIVIYPVDACTLFMGGERYILSVYHDGRREYKIHHNNIDKYVKWEDAAVAGIEYAVENLI